MSIYVGNLSYEVTEADLSSVFAEYGSVKRVSVPTDRDSGRVRGFAFIEMGSEEQKKSAIEALDGAEWMGRTMKVNKARERENRSYAGSGRGYAGSGQGQRRNRF